MSSYNINITLKELTAWAFDDYLKTPSKRESITEYLSGLEFIAPLKVYLKAKKLIVDEGADVDDVSFIVEDTSTGIKYPYNPPLGCVFD